MFSGGVGGIMCWWQNHNKGVGRGGVGWGGVGDRDPDSEKSGGLIGETSFSLTLFVAELVSLLTFTLKGMESCISFVDFLLEQPMEWQCSIVPPFILLITTT